MKRSHAVVALLSAGIIATFSSVYVVAQGIQLLDGNPVVVTNGVFHMGDSSSDEANAVAYERASAPSNPSTGAWSLYPKSDGWYQLDDAGSENRLATAAEIAAFIDGSGTATYVPYFTDSNTLADSYMVREGTSGIMSISDAGAAGGIYLRYNNSTITGSWIPTTLSFGDALNAADTNLYRPTAGKLRLDGENNAGAMFQWLEDSDNGGNYFEIGSASARTTDQTVYWPDDTPSDGDFLEWNTGGILEWTAGGGGGGTPDSIVSPDTNTDATVYDAVGSGYQLTVEGTLMQKQLQTQLDLYDDNIRLFDQLNADTGGDLYFMGGTTSTTGSYRINWTSPSAMSFNHNASDIDTSFSTAGGNTLRIDGGLEAVGIKESFPYAALSVEGGVQWGYVEKTSSFTYDPTGAGNDDDSVVLLDCATGDLTVTLPNPDSSRPYRVTFVRVDSSTNECIIDANSTWEISGEQSHHLWEQWETMTLQAGSSTNMGGTTEWAIIDHTIPSTRLNGYPLASLSAAATHSGNTTETVLASITIPEDRLQDLASGGTVVVFDFYGYTQATTGSPSCIWRLRQNGTGGTALLTWTRATLSPGAEQCHLRGQINLYTTGAGGTGAAHGTYTTLDRTATFVNDHQTNTAVSLNTTGSMTFDITVEWSAGSAFNIGALDTGYFEAK